MSAASIRQRLAAATPTEWIAASGKGKLSVVGTKDANGHSYALAVFSAVPATHRKADAGGRIRESPPRNSSSSVSCATI